MSGHAVALQDILARHTERQRMMQDERHAYAPNTRGTCTACGKGRHWHIERGWTR